MSGIVLSSSVRQNLLSLQSTADLLATTQNRLATGKKVNSALDNPTNFFTASSLDSRAGDINNLLDGIGNGVQVLQAANTGITSLQKLVDTAKSIANQALQTTVGYSTKSIVSAIVIDGATADLRGADTSAPRLQRAFSGACRRHPQPRGATRRHRRCAGWHASSTIAGTGQRDRLSTLLSSAHHHRGQRRRRRRRHPDRQRQDDHLQVGANRPRRLRRLPPDPCVIGNIAHRR